MKLRPLHDKVLVKRTEEEETSSGGIILSGEVVPVNVNAGDTVLFGQYSGNEVKVDGEEYLIMSESDIFGVIE
jgi:chaperonin GroES